MLINVNQTILDYSSRKDLHGKQGTKSEEEVALSVRRRTTKHTHTHTFEKILMWYTNRSIFHLLSLTSVTGRQRGSWKHLCVVSLFLLYLHLYKTNLWLEVLALLSPTSFMGSASQWFAQICVSFHQLSEKSWWNSLVHASIVVFRFSGRSQNCLVPGTLVELCSACDVLRVTGTCNWLLSFLCLFFFLLQ